MEDQKPMMELRVPATMEHALVVRMALSGAGMLAGLEVGLIDDLRTATDECFDCLLHQAFELKEVITTIHMEEGRLCCRFCAVPTQRPIAQASQDPEITRCILETLLPEVRLSCDESGVSCISFSMPV